MIIYCYYSNVPMFFNNQQLAIPQFLWLLSRLYMLGEELYSSFTIQKLPILFWTIGSVIQIFGTKATVHDSTPSSIFTILTASWSCPLAVTTVLRSRKQSPGLTCSPQHVCAVQLRPLDELSSPTISMSANCVGAGIVAPRWTMNCCPSVSSSSTSSSIGT